MTQALLAWLLSVPPAIGRLDCRLARLPRLWLWVPGTGWLPAMLPLNATKWDAEYWRIEFRARKIPTVWIKNAT
jgi:hypothetical protein